jgi:aspartate dehydrogenase
MLTIGIIGSGAIGSIIARAIDAGEVGGHLVAIADLDRPRAESLAGILDRTPEIRTIREIAAQADLIVEAAGTAAVTEVLREAIPRGKDVLVLSVGGLVDASGWIDQASNQGTRIYCPSGAIAGLDAIKAANIGKIESARITTRKPPGGLAGAPYLQEHDIDVLNLAEPKIVFEGSAREACFAFPANVNVSAALALAGIGIDKTRVRLIADPGISRNIHEIEVEGDFGVIRTVTENVPSQNPKTSRLAALSAIALLKHLTGALRIGT